MQPKISIITVCYNAVQIIEETILSVINQTYTNIEYIIIDGGSNDGTVDIINKYNDKISYWVSEPDKGIYDAMNKGIEKATGEWVNFMNAGDSFCSLSVISELNREGAFDSCDLVYGDVIGKYKIGNRLLKAGNLKNITKTMQFSHQSTFAKCSLMKENLYVLTYRLAADYNFILSLYFCKRLNCLSEQRNLMFFNDFINEICLVSKLLFFEIASKGNNADCLSFFDLNRGNPRLSLKKLS